MKKIFAFCLLIAVVFSCKVSNEQDLMDPKPIQEEDVVALTHLTSTFEDGQKGKSTLADDKSVLWDPADEILVFCGGESAVFTSTNTEQAAVADFAGEIIMKEPVLYALYPCQEGAGLENGQITASVPSVQQAIEGTYPKEAFVSLAKAADGNLKFYHLCGLLKIRFSMDGIREVALSANGEEKLAGKVMIQLSETGIPTVADYLDAKTQVTLKAPTGGFKKDTDYYMALLPGTLQSGFTMSAVVGTKTGTWKKTVPTTITRAVYSKATAPDEKMEFDYSVDYSAPEGMVTVNVSKRGELEDELTALSATSASAIKVTGVMNDVDILYLNSMTSLQYLDISAIEFAGLPSKAFQNNKYIKTLLLPNSLTSIAATDLNGSAVQTIVIGKNVEAIDGSAFNGCTSLENVIFAEDIALTVLKTDTFKGCTALKEIDIPSSIVTIEAYAFRNCSALANIYFNQPTHLETIGGLADLPSFREIVIPASVKTIADEAFQNCTGLVSVAFEGGAVLDTIRDNTFLNCTSLVTVTLPEFLTVIGSYAFSRCSSLKIIDFPRNVSIIGSNAFSWCSSLEDILLPNSIEEIGAAAFSNCGSLSSFALPEKLTIIPERMFFECSKLNCVVLPSGLTKISSYAFYGCNSLSEIPLEGTKLTSIGDYAFVYSGLSGVIRFPASLSEIGERAFHSLDNISGIIFPEGSEFRSFSWQCFKECAGLERVVFEGLCQQSISVGVAAFNGCTSLTTVNAEHCNHLDKILGAAFAGCSSLRLFYNGTVKPATCDSQAFSGIAPNAILKVRPESVSQYQSANEWRNFSSITSLEGHVTGVALDITQKTLNVGDEVTLAATVSPTTALNKEVRWSSSKEAVATVDQEGKVQAIAPGTTTITARTADGDYTSTCAIKVVEKMVESITIPPSVVAHVGYKTTLTYTVLPEDASEKKVAWLSSDTSVATIDAYGRITGVSTGTAQITATAGDGSGVTATCEVEVRQYVTSITLDKTSISLNEGENTVLNVTSVLPDNAYDNSYSWSTSDESVAIVDEMGRVTAISKGGATIKAIANDGSGKYASCSVTVKRLVSSIQLNKTTLTLYRGSSNVTETLTATVSPSSASNTSVTWTSSNTAVAAVSSSGVVTGKSRGNATITVTANDGSNVNATCEVEVKQYVTSITLSKTSLSLVIGEEETISVTSVLPDNANDKTYTWSSSDESIATVDQTGKVTAVSKGTVTIKASATDGSEKYASCSVTVKRLVSSIQLNKASLVIYNGTSETLTATVTPSSASNTSVTWTSSNSAVATVSSSGVVTGKSLGNATITVTANDGSNVNATCEVEVKQYVTSITISKTSLFLMIGEEETISVTSVLPDNANDKSYTWSSADSAIASVDDSGKVTARANGNVTIKATANDGSGVFASCSVIVFAEKVDMGIKTSDGKTLYWSTRNLCESGFVSSPEIYGDYYAWGETETKDNYSWSTYKFGTSSFGPFSKYNTSSSYGTVDNKTVLETGPNGDDVASKKLGGSWRMPTEEEWTELINNCTWTWTTNYNGTGVKGRIVTAPNGNSIFLPAAGFRSSSYLYYVGSYGLYWSSSLDTDYPYLAWLVRFDSDDVRRFNGFRYGGQSVRPVSE